MAISNLILRNCIVKGSAQEAIWQACQSVSLNGNAGRNVATDEALECKICNCKHTFGRCSLGYLKSILPIASDFGDWI
jgi:hypothetical protein